MGHGFGVDHGTLGMLRMLTDMASMKVTVEERYRSPDDNGPAFDGEVPSLKEGLHFLVSYVRSLPKSMLQAVKGIENLANGLDTISLQGMPHKYKFVATFDNFHITPVLVKMMG